MNPEQKKLFHQATELDQTHDWQKSADLWLDLSQQVDQAEILMKAAHALYQAKRYQEAYSQLLTYLQEHPEAPIDLPKLVKIYLAANHYISVRMIIMQQGGSQQAELLKMVARDEDIYRTEFKTTLQNHLRSFYHLGDCPIREQQSRLAAADQLPLNEFLTGCQFLLRDPFTNAFVRAELFNILQRLQYHDQVTMLCIDDQEHQIIPAKISSAYEMDSIRQCRQLLNARFANSDPQMGAALNQQLDLQAILLNPLTDQIITDPLRWVQTMTQRALNQLSEDSSSTDGRWQDKINQIIEKIH